MAFDITSFKQVTDRLNNNPIYRLSLSSRELFHSNFLVWLFETQPSTIELILGLKHQFKEIHREKHNIDILLVNSSLKQVVAIENKVKDTPRKAQLDEYSEKLDKQFPAPLWKLDKILLALSPSTFGLEGTGWIEMSYAELGARISSLPAIPDLRTETITKAYAEMAIDLDFLAKQIFAEDKVARTFWFKNGQIDSTEEIDSKLEQIRFADTFQKHRASLLLDAIEKKINKSESLNALPRYSGKKGFDGLMLSAKHDLTNKTPYAEACLLVELDKKVLRLGVQIQGTQYRRFLMWDVFFVKDQEKADQQRIREFVEKHDCNRWLFGTDQDSHGILINSGYFKGKERINSSMTRNTYRSYAPHFVYQYVNISTPESKAGLHPSDLASALVSDLVYARELLDDPSFTSGFR